MEPVHAGYLSYAFCMGEPGRSIALDPSSMPLSRAARGSIQGALFRIAGCKERLQSVGGRLSVHFATLHVRSVVTLSPPGQAWGETATLAWLVERP